jgi:hypothetical protein
MKQYTHWPLLALIIPAMAQAHMDDDPLLGMLNLTSSPPSNLRFAAVRRKGRGFPLQDGHARPQECSWPH